MIYDLLIFLIWEGKENSRVDSVTSRENYWLNHLDHDLADPGNEWNG